MSHESDINLNRHELSIFQKCFFPRTLLSSCKIGVSARPPTNAITLSYHEINVLTISSTLVIQNSGKIASIAENARSIWNFDRDNDPQGGIYYIYNA